MRHYWILLAALLALMSGPVFAAAGFTSAQAPVEMNLEGLGGVEQAAAYCDGGTGADQAACVGDGGTWVEAVAADTGWYEIRGLVAPGLIVAVSVIISFVGFYMIRSLIMRVRG